MNAYLPRDPVTIALVGAVLLADLLAGLGLTRLRPGRWPRLLAWLLVVSATVGVERLCAAEPAGVRMLAIIAALLFGMKAVVGVEARADGAAPLPAGRWLAFAAGWPGMRPAIFARTVEQAALPAPPSRAGKAACSTKRLPDAWPLLALGTRRLLLGAALFVAAWLVWHRARPPLADGAARLLATVLLLPAVSLVLHFGAFTLLAGFWRLRGIDARPLFRAPLASRSLAEFWGRRWNLAFSEMTAIGVYRPLAKRLGRGPATFGAFACSGVLHELAISVPVQAGYGLPLTYFALHGLLALLEGRLERAGRAVSSWGWAVHLWVLGWLALPLPLLFHPPFLRGVVWPLVGMSGD